MQQLIQKHALIKTQTHVHIWGLRQDTQGLMLGYITKLSGLEPLKG